MTTAFDRISGMTGEQRATLADRFAKASRLAGGEPVAVVGVGCRFPGDVHGLDSYWQLLVEGRDAITEVPDDRWDAERYYDPDWSTPGRMNTKWGGFLSDIADFDADFFGISPREAETMDPQQRLLLEVTWEALEHAGIRLDSLSETRTAVMVGVYRNEYLAASLANSESMSAYWATGNAHSITVGRISYLLGLRGPAVAFDTACSSSLVAVHGACQSLRMRESDVALAGGVSLMLRAETQLAMSAWGMFSPSGKCRSFDAGADGFVRGEGCGVVVLKRLTDAVRDGDRVLAVVRGSAINSDGRSNGLTAPNAPSQRDVITAALRNADVTAESVNYIETHGTGTTLGDPIEFDAVAQTYGRGAGKCGLGAVKTNIGHLEAPAGIAGFIKATLALRHGHIPPNLNFVDWNPAIDASGTRLFVPTTNAAWPVTDGPRRAAVSSFGFGGTNAHVVLEQGPDAEARIGSGAPESSVATLLVSAKTPERLAIWAATLADWLEGPGAQVPLADVADTLAHRRARYPVLARVSAGGRAQAVDGLRALAGHRPAVGVVAPKPRHTQLAAIAPPKADASACRPADLPTTPWRHARFWVEDRPGDLEESPETAPSAERGPQVLLLSARNADSLQDARTSLAETLARGNALALPDVAYTLAHRRSEEHRLVAVVHDRATAAGLLTAAEHDNVSVAQCPQGIPAGTERVAFLFPGQGAQHVGMARGLFDTEPVFREHFDRCAGGFADDLGIDLKEQVFAGTDLERTDLAQPALFAVEYALAQLVMSYGVKPAALAGHSIGELVAATVADVFDLPTALKVVALRARLMHTVPGGVMVAVAATPENIRAHLARLDEDVDVAAINDHGSCVVGGSGDAIAELTDRLAAQGILARRVRTSHAFHSQSMDEVLPRFAEHLASVTLHEPTIPMLSNITGTWMTAAEATDPERWARHIRSTVRFADEVQVLLGDPHRVLVEVGPAGSLTGSAVRLPAWGGTHRAVRLMRHPLQSRDDRDAFLLALGQLWSAGIDVDWTALQGEQAHRVILPGYPSACQRHWIEPADVQQVITSAGRRADAAPPSTNGADPCSQMQATLQRIWAQCLGLESLNPGDNFFELGGDSLTAVGVAMAANHEGLDLNPQDLYENHSLAALADTLVARYASGGLTGDVPANLGLPLPPNICRFLDTGLAERGRWRVPLELRLDSRVSAADVTAVVSAVISHHDALRMRLVKRSGTWEQQIAEPGGFTDVVERALPSAVASDSVEEREALSAIVTDTVRDQDLHSWPLTATYVTDATGAARFLLLTVHQMVNDTTSREVLLTDLLTAFAQRLAGQDIALEPVSTSWREWSRRCAALSAHPALLDRRGYWLNVAKASLRVAESSAAGQPPGADDLVRLPGALTTEQTSMIDNAGRLLQVGIDETLLSGLARTIAAVVGEGIIAVDLAGTGRSVLKPEVDLRRTVGWFSTVYPIALPCVKPAATGGAHLLAEVRQNVKAVPYHGIGYGVLRYLHAPTAGLLEAVAAPDIHFTYLGITPEWPQSDAEVHWDSGSEPAHCGTVPGLGHPIELRVYRRGGALRVDFWYDRRRVPRATIEALAERFPATLIGLVDEAVTGHVGERATDADAEDEALVLVDLSAAVLDDD